MKNNCKQCVRRSTCLGQTLVGNANDEIVQQNINGILPAETLIYRQSDPLMSLNIVHSGAVKTYYLNEDGEEQITGFFLPGQLFGLSGLSCGSYMDSAQALITSSICQFDFKSVELVLSKNPTLQRSFIQLLGMNIHTEQKHQMILCQKNADSRLSAFLLKLSAYGESRNMSSLRFIMPMSRRDIGNYLGMALETVSRVLTKLEDNKILVVNRKEIEIIDKHALVQVSHGDWKPTSHGIVGRYQESYAEAI